MIINYFDNVFLNLDTTCFYPTLTFYATLVNTYFEFCKCVGFNSQNSSNLIASYSSKRPVYRLLYSFCLLFNKTDLIAPSFQIHILNVH